MEHWPPTDDLLRRAAGIAAPGCFDIAMAFRRCTDCGCITIVKDNCFECAVCGADLPTAWNCDAQGAP